MISDAVPNKTPCDLATLPIHDLMQWTNDADTSFPSGSSTCLKRSKVPVPSFPLGAVFHELVAHFRSESA